MRGLFYLFQPFLIISLLFGCNSRNEKTSDDEKIVNQVVQEIAEKLREEKKLILIGTGGQMMYKIEMLAMSFNYYHEVDLPSARDLIVYVINEYVSSINSNEKIKPYLCEYPFTSKNVEIRIWILNPNGSAPSVDKIYYISAIDGNLAYYLDLPKTHSRQAICRETYEEALRTSSQRGVE